MKPIHKFNNGEGATLCRSCYGIINLGWSDEVICSKCKGYIEPKKSEKKK
jgi:hypothetical protein